MLLKIKQHLVYWMPILLGIVSACSPSIPSNSDWERLHLRGQVHHFEEWTYSSYKAFQNQQHNLHQKSWFNKQGQLTQVVHYETENRLWWSYYTYKEDSVWIRRALQVDGGAEQNQNYWLYELNQHGQQKVLTSLQMDTSIFHTITITYNEQHLPSLLTYSNQLRPEIVPCQVQRTYNEQAQVVQEAVTLYDETTQQCHSQPTVSTYQYNEQGDIEREKIVYHNGKEENYSYQYQYDATGNWTTCLNYAGDQVIEVSQRKLVYY